MTVQRRAVEADPETGQASETWVDMVGILWVSVETRGGAAKGEYDDAILATERKVAVLDYRKGLAFSIKDHRLVSVENGLVFNITEVSDGRLQHHIVELTLEELVT